MKRGSMNGQKPANIHDVAAHAGVSIKTVSRVLNREPNVTPKTRDRVLDAVQALSYRPNIFARSLASERSFIIGVIFDNPSAGYVAGIQYGALAKCREEGYHLLVEVFSEGEKDLGERVLTLVRESLLHGIIVTPPLSDSPEVLSALKESGTRFVRIAPERAMPDTLEVRIDDAKAAFDMTSHLIGLGHRRIGFIIGHPGHGAANQRFMGYKAALENAGIKLDPKLCVQGYFSYQSGMEAAERLLTLKNRPTAIFASNDDMAAAVLSTAHKHGLRTPEDLSVSGFDDTLIAQVVWPKLTTCRQPIAEMAAQAVSMLAQPPADKDAPKEALLEHELVIRESTAAPNA
ncbi:MAG: LacI family DNA-binding transcriptional regulator [Hyphomonadaceae bacterium]|nr:LacI family DNA-binding transcriptional regulator [Hyphomonadaceae bacterium]